MHDLVQEMGKTINSEKSPTQPGRWCRLWNLESEIDVLTNTSGTEDIEPLSLDLPKKSVEILDTLCLIQCLILLQVEFIRHPNLELLRKLKILDFSGSCNLKKLPDFSWLPNLEKLKLPGRWSLSNSPLSIGQLKELSLEDFDDCGQLRCLPGENVIVKSSVNMANSAVMQANSAEWIFLVSSLCMEILSAACDQASSPSRPQYSLFGMLLAFAALLTCIWELIYKGRKKNVGWGKRGCYMLFGSAIESYGLVGGIAQCVCSIIQYVCHIQRVDTPIKLSLLPAIFLICLITARLSRNRMEATNETHEHIA